MIKKISIALIGLSLGLSSCASNKNIDVTEQISDEMMDEDFAAENMNQVIASSANAHHVDHSKLTGNFMNAQAGECFARTLSAPVYKTVSYKVELSPEKTRLSVTPEKYEWMEERILVKPAGKRLVQVPAEYGFVSERVLSTPEHFAWKKGNGGLLTAAQAKAFSANSTSGEVLCKVKIPATYKTIRKKVLKKAASVNETMIPAEYKTVKVKKLVKEAKVNKTVIPAEFGTNTRRELVKNSQLKWQKVLCQTNSNSSSVMRVQSALRKAGHSVNVDGVLGNDTMRAVTAYQKANGLATGALTLETIKKMGLSL